MAALAGEQTKLFCACDNHCWRVFESGFSILTGGYRSPLLALELATKKLSGHIDSAY